MKNYKGLLVGAGAVLLLVGSLFGAGVLKISGEEDESDASAVAPDDGGKKRRGRKSRRKRGRKKGRKKSDQDKLGSLAYLGEIPLTEETRDKSGVTVRKHGSSDGLLLANAAGGGNTGRRRRRSPHLREASLWDADGKKLHTWSSDAITRRRSWTMTRLDSDGFLYAVVADSGLVKLDWDSNLVWSLRGRIHHDFTFLEDGRIAALVERRIVIDAPTGYEKGTGIRLLDQGVVVIDPDGNVEEQLWLYEAFKDTEIFQSRLRRGLDAKKERVLVEPGDAERPGGLDIFHANSVVELPRDVEGLGSKGDLLLSFRHMSTVASISRQTHQVSWSWGAENLVRQHDATLTANDEVVLFDNRTRDENSRVVVVDPKTNEIVRTIGGANAAPPLAFFSMGRGLAQELESGNILVVSSNEGRVFEVTPENALVWEFWSPWMGKKTRRPIRAVRIEGPLSSSLSAIVEGSRQPPSVAEHHSPRTLELSIPPFESTTDVEPGAPEPTEHTD